jgi:hypothetical protein
MVTETRKINFWEVSIEKNRVHPYELLAEPILFPPGSGGRTISLPAGIPAADSGGNP